METSPTPKVLFILKLRQHSGGEYTVLKHSGLFNSATFVSDMLVQNGYESHLVQVVDNNSINREVTLYKPDIVIIEALWVVPPKFDVLAALHPNVKWIIRLHSELPFLANEGIAIEWINAYVRHPNVWVSANSEHAQRDLYNYLATIGSGELVNKLVYLPNYYPTKNTTHKPKTHWLPGDEINIGCFGAIRPLKNHLIQAAAAVQFAEERGLKCRFHINGTRVEGRGDVVLKNVQAFFAGLGGKHELVQHDWMDREDFLKVIRTMDLGLQVSLSETFNIISADFADEKVTMITSSEVDWMPWIFTAKPTDSASIVAALNRAMLYNKYLFWLNYQKLSLIKYVDESEKIWLDNLPNIR